MTDPRTIMIMAGGTGGHIMPGLAVAEVLRARGWKVVWLGSQHAMEGRIVPTHGIKLSHVDFSGVRGKGLVNLAKLPFRLCRAMAQVRSHFKEHKPALVLGMGGYVAFPGGLMAALTGVPLVLHEQNSIAGLTNRVLARFAKQVLSGFPSSLPKSLFVGNPVRAGLSAIPKPAERFAARTGVLNVLVVGGSLGAQALNQVVPQALALMTESERPKVIHQSGEKFLTQLEQNYVAHKVQAQCVAFIQDMSNAYEQADLVICRAGAMTVAEVAAVGVPALFIPFPFAVDDHQTANARFLTEKNAAWLQAQANLTATWLADWLSARTRPELVQFASNAKAAASDNAATKIADICEGATTGRHNK